LQHRETTNTGSLINEFSPHDQRIRAVHNSELGAAKGKNLRARTQGQPVASHGRA
jgi:hypothetical protein